jgi:Asp-tRNA(Asn)/Glu-tRNA(Gln) amidotransferase A subunit family amidase
MEHKSSNSDPPEPADPRSTESRIKRLDAEIAAFVSVATADSVHRPDASLASTDRLTGIAVAVKDLFRVDGLPTQAGSRLPEDLFEGPESDVVTRLRYAGASIVGKTAMDEFAYCEPPPTKNPLDLRRTPGGSSGGSAAAVAAGMCPLAVGSQTLQSTIVPASFCGVFGFKPTFDRIRFDGVPLAPSIDTVGFLGSTLEMVKAAAEQVLPDWKTVNGSTRPVLGVPQRWGFRRHVEGWDAFDRHVDTLAGAGFELRHASLPWNEDLDYWATVIRDQLHREFASVHTGWYAEHADLYRPCTRQAVELGQAVSDARLDECRTAQETLRDMLDQLTTQTGVDCWICPAAGTVAPLGYDVTGDGWMTSFWSYAGWPSISIPIFDGDNGLPYGLQCVAPAGQDEPLLKWCAGISTALTGQPATNLP